MTVIKPANELGTDNFIINGAFDIWQRSTASITFTTTRTYTADRWAAFTDSATGSVIQTADHPSNGEFCLQLTKPSGNIELNTRLEAKDSRLLVNKNITISFWVKRTGGSNSQLGLELKTPATVDGWGGTVTQRFLKNDFVTTASWQYIYITIPAGIVNVQNGLQIGFIRNTDADLTVLRFADVMLNIGSVPAVFAKSGRTLQGELANCQRYYWKLDTNATNASTIYGFGMATSSGTVKVQFQNPVTMRAVPTVNNNGSGNVLSDGASFPAVSWAAPVTTDQSKTIVTINGTGSFTDKRTYFVAGSSGGFLNLSVDAEL